MSIAYSEGISTLRRWPYAIASITYCIPVLALAATADPSGVSGAIFLAAFLLTFVLFLIVGAGFGGWRGAIVGAAGYGMGLVVLFAAGLVDDYLRESRYKERLIGISLCKAELGTMASEYFVDSLLLEAGIVDQSHLRNLLGAQGLQYVEMKSRDLGNSTFGVIAVSGDDRSTYISKSPYVRIALGEKSSKDCARGRTLGLDFANFPQAPISPDACMTIVETTEARATHALKALPIADLPGYIRWSIVERSTTKVLTGITSNDSSDSPVRQGTSDGTEIKNLRHGSVSCRSPYFTLISGLTGQSSRNLPRLTLTQNQIAVKALGRDEQYGAWPILTVEAQTVAKEEFEKHLFHQRELYTHGDGWIAAFRKAQLTGMAAAGNVLVDYGKGEIISLTVPDYTFNGSPAGGKTFASKYGFIVATDLYWNYSRGIILARYSRSGSLEWKGMIRPNQWRFTPTETKGRFWPEAIDWDGSRLLIYGTTRKLGQDIELWKLVVPTPEEIKGANH